MSPSIVSLCRLRCSGPEFFPFNRPAAPVSPEYTRNGPGNVLYVLSHPEIVRIRTSIVKVETDLTITDVRDHNITNSDLEVMEAPKATSRKFSR